MINLENVEAMYRKPNGTLEPQESRDKNKRKPKKEDRNFSEATKVAINSCLIYGKGQLIKDIAKRLGLSHSHIARYCRHMESNNLLKSQLADDSQPYGVKAFYLIDDNNLPPTKYERNENQVLEIIIANSGIIKADIKKLCKGLTDYAVTKALTGLEDKKKIKHTNIAPRSAGGRAIYSWSVK